PAVARQAMEQGRARARPSRGQPAQADEEGRWRADRAARRTRLSGAALRGPVGARPAEAEAVGQAVRREVSGSRPPPPPRLSAKEKARIAPGLCSFTYRR